MSKMLFHRCAICDHCNLDNEERRDFVFDRSTSEYHCMLCAKEINETISDDEFEEYDFKEPFVPYHRRTEAHRRGGQKNKKDSDE